MGTFHSHKGELHGITVVVETKDERVFVGRCDSVTTAEVILLDADAYPALDGAAHRRAKPSHAPESRDAFLDAAKRLGVWPRIPHIAVPRSHVTAITRLTDLATS